MYKHIKYSAMMVVSVFCMFLLGLFSLTQLFPLDKYLPLSARPEICYARPEFFL